MRNKLLFILSFLFLVSCSSIDKKIFKSDKGNYIKTGDGDFIKANYSQVSEINSKSNYQITINNDQQKSLFVFSTVIENSLLFYSQRNYSSKKGTIKLDSFYKNYMNDVSNSGVKRFNFIEVQPNEDLVINIDKELVSDYDNLEFTYYYFYSKDKPELLNITNDILEKRTLLKEIK